MSGLPKVIVFGPFQEFALSHCREPRFPLAVVQEFAISSHVIQETPRVEHGTRLVRPREIRF